MTKKKTENALLKLTIHKLQRLRDITLEFAPVGVTAIMGVNGSGKSTALRALACIYQPIRNQSLQQTPYVPADFFVPYDGYDWSGCHFEAWIDGQEESRSFQREENGSWSPNPTNRFQRYVKYIPISDAIPDIERDDQKSAISYSRGDFWDVGSAKQRTFLRKVGETLNRDYSNAGSATKDTGQLKSFMFAEVRDRTLGNLAYPSHYMGAGEQKIFEIVKAVINAPKGSLILIEEPEISLHNKAMRDLMLFLKQQADEKSLQIVISTHWLGITEVADSVAIYSLVVDQDTESVRCRQGVLPTDLVAVSGNRADVRRITVWVEDVLASRFVDHIANHLGIRQFIKKIGIGRSARNLFSIAAALVIEHEHPDEVLIVGDGDRDTTDEEKRRAMERLIHIEDELPLDGPNAWALERRNLAVSLICEFSSPDNINPEDFLLNTARRMDVAGRADQWLQNDLRDVSRMRPAPSGKAAFYQLAQSKSSSDRPEDIRAELERLHERYIQTIQSTQEWRDYIAPVAERLEALCRQHRLIQPRAEAPVVATAEAA